MRNFYYIASFKFFIILVQSGSREVDSPDRVGIFDRQLTANSGRKQIPPPQVTEDRDLRVGMTYLSACISKRTISTETTEKSTEVTEKHQPGSADVRHRGIRAGARGKPCHHKGKAAIRLAAVQKKKKPRLAPGRTFLR